MVELNNQEYTIKNTVNGCTVGIVAIVSSDGELTIRTEKNQPQFVFTKSDPELVQAMAECLADAYNLVKSSKAGKE